MNFGLTSLLTYDGINPAGRRELSQSFPDSRELHQLHYIQQQGFLIPAEYLFWQFHIHKHVRQVQIHKFIFVRVFYKSNDDNDDINDDNDNTALVQNVEEKEDTMFAFDKSQSCQHFIWLTWHSWHTHVYLR